METGKKDVLNLYFRWPFYLGILFAVLSAGAFFYDVKLAIGLLIGTALYGIAALVFYLVFRRKIHRRLRAYGPSFADTQNQMLRQIRIPFAMTNGAGEILWLNDEFRAAFPAVSEGTVLTRAFPELDTLRLKDGEDLHLAYEDRRYQMTAFRIGEDKAAGLDALGDPADRYAYNVYFLDETDLLAAQKTLEEERSVIGLIYLDNYEEVMEDVEYVRRSLLSALVERKLNQYVSGVRGVIRKLEKDRFFVVVKQEALWKMEADQFSLLEDIKTVSIGNERAMTISIGIGMGGETIEQNYDFARAAIDMALGRGGDQAVLKDGADIRYYGGKAKSTERNTRVKARIKAQALRELIEAKDSVMIMGHSMSDLDCLGAGVGIYRAARFSGKRAYIVLNEMNNSIRPLVEQFTKNSEYGEEMFLTPEQALERFDPDMLLVVVDTNRPSYTECPELLERGGSVVVMDHHRQGRERIEDALLSYVEPYASSASEMVAEVVQYYDEDLRLRPLEAEAVFAGIVMDTNNFEDKAGVRTFEAAAYLRRCGADAARVRKLFRESFDDYKLRAETIRNAETYLDDYIIAVCPSGEDDPNRTVIAAQAANALLNIENVKASFVLTEHDHKIYISARSIDEVNVQVLMEKLGGGGHLSIAGAQLQDVTLEEAKEQLKQVISGTGA